MSWAGAYGLPGNGRFHAADPPEWVVHFEPLIRDRRGVRAVAIRTRHEVELAETFLVGTGVEAPFGERFHTSRTTGIRKIAACPDSPTRVAQVWGLESRIYAQFKT